MLNNNQMPLSDQFGSDVSSSNANIFLSPSLEMFKQVDFVYCYFLWTVFVCKRFIFFILKSPTLILKAYIYQICSQQSSMNIKIICLAFVVIGTHCSINIHPFQITKSRSIPLCQHQFSMSTDGNIATCDKSLNQTIILKWHQKSNSYRIIQTLHEDKYDSYLSRDGLMLGMITNKKQVLIYLYNSTSGQFQIIPDSKKIDAIKGRKQITQIYISDNHQSIFLAYQDYSYDIHTHFVNLHYHRLISATNLSQSIALGYYRFSAMTKKQADIRIFVSQDNSIFLVSIPYVISNRYYIDTDTGLKIKLVEQQESYILCDAIINQSYINQVNIFSPDSYKYAGYLSQYDIANGNFDIAPFIANYSIGQSFDDITIKMSKNARYVAVINKKHNQYTLSKLVGDQFQIVRDKENDLILDQKGNVRDLYFMDIQGKNYHLIRYQNSVQLYFETDECNNDEEICECAIDYQWNNNRGTCQILNCQKEHATGQKDYNGKCICDVYYLWNDKQRKCQKQIIQDISPFKLQTHISQCKTDFQMSQNGQFAACQDKILKWDSQNYEYTTFQTIKQEHWIDHWIQNTHMTQSGLMFIIQQRQGDQQHSGYIYYRNSVSDYFEFVQSIHTKFAVDDNHKYMLALRNIDDDSGLQKYSVLTYNEFNPDTLKYQQKSMLKAQHYTQQPNRHKYFSISHDGNTVVYCSLQNSQIQIFMKTADKFQKFDTLKVQVNSKIRNILAVNYDVYPQIYVSGLRDDSSNFIMKYNLQTKENIYITSPILQTAHEKGVIMKQIKFSKNAEYITFISTTNQYALGQIFQDHIKMITDQVNWAQFKDLQDVSFGYIAQLKLHYHSITSKGGTIIYKNQNCQIMQGALSTNQDGTCECISSYEWDQNTKKCVKLNCKSKQYTKGSIDASGHCICLQGYLWNQIYKVCQLRCLPIQGNNCNLNNQGNSNDDCLQQNEPNCPLKFQFIQHFSECTHKFQLVNNGLMILCAGPDQDQVIRFKILRRSSNADQFITFQTFDQQFIETSVNSYISKDGLMFSLYTLIQIQGFGNRHGMKIYYAQDPISMYNVILSQPYIDKLSHISDNHQFVFINRRSHSIYQLKSHARKLSLSSLIKDYGERQQTYVRISNNGKAAVIFMENNIYVYHRGNIEEDFKVTNYTIQPMYLRQSTLDANFDLLPTIYISGSKLTQLFVIKFDMNTQQFTLIREFKSIFCDTDYCQALANAEWSSLSRNGKYVSFANKNLFQLSKIQGQQIEIKAHWQKGDLTQIKDLSFSDSLQLGYEYQIFRDSKTGGYIYKVYTGFIPSKDIDDTGDQKFVDCKKDKLWDEVNTYVDSCGCIQSAQWNQETQKCQYKCQNGILQTHYDGSSSCVCKEKYGWNQYNKQCFYDCKNYGGKYSLGLNIDSQICICQNGAYQEFGAQQCLSQCLDSEESTQACSNLSIQHFQYVDQYPSCINGLQLADNGLIALCTGISSDNTQRAIVWKRQSVLDDFYQFQILPLKTNSFNQITKDGRMIIIQSQNIAQNTVDRHVFYSESSDSLYGEIQIFYDQKQRIAISDNHQYLVYTGSNVKILKFNQIKFEQVNLIQGQFQQINCLQISDNGNAIFVGTKSQGYLYYRQNQFSDYQKNIFNYGFNSCAVNINAYPTILLAGSVLKQNKNQLIILYIQLQCFILTQIEMFSPHTQGEQQGYASLTQISDNGQYIAFSNSKDYFIGQVQDRQFYSLTQQWIKNNETFQILDFFNDQQESYIYLTITTSVQFGHKKSYAFRIQPKFLQALHQQKLCLNDPLWDGKYVGDMSCGCLDRAVWDIYLQKCVQICQNAEDQYQSSCKCQDNYFWSNKERFCVIDCQKIDGILNLRQRKSNTECLCQQNAYWNQISQRCQLDCNKIDNAVGNNGIMACNCQKGFIWNSKKMQCETQAKDQSKIRNYADSKKANVILQI